MDFECDRLYLFKFSFLSLNYRFIPSEGQYEPENEVESTYKIWIPSSIQNYQLPRFRPVQESLHLPVHTQIYQSGFSITHPPAQQLRVPFYPTPQVNVLQKQQLLITLHFYHDFYCSIVSFRTHTVQAPL